MKRKQLFTMVLALVMVAVLINNGFSLGHDDGPGDLSRGTII